MRRLDGCLLTLHQALFCIPPQRALVIENSHTHFTDEGTVAGLKKPCGLLWSHSQYLAGQGFEPRASHTLPHPSDLPIAQPSPVLVWWSDLLVMSI